MTIKKVEHQRNETSKWWCWRRLLRIPGKAKRSNQSILKEINSKYSLEGLLLNWSSNTLATWFEELIQWNRPWCWERLKAGGEGDDRRWDGWMPLPTQWTWVWVNSGSWWWTGRPGTLQSMGSQNVGHDWVTNTCNFIIFDLFLFKYTMIFAIENVCSRSLIIQFSLVAQSCLTLCNHMDCSMPGLPVHRQLPEFTQTHVHWVVDAIQRFHPLSSPSPPSFNLSQHQGLFKCVNSLHQVAKVLDFQLQHQSFQWTPRPDLL